MKKYILIIAALVFSNFIFAQQKGMVTIIGTLNGDLKDTIKFICSAEHPMIPYPSISLDSYRYQIRKYNGHSQ